MKHQELIDKFLSKRDENDGFCDILWLPAFPDGGPFHNVLPEPRVDILAVYLDTENGYDLSFLTSSEDDYDQLFVRLSALPFSVQKKVYNYIFE